MSQVYGVPYAITPEWILDAEISDRAVRLWGCLHRYAREDGRAFPGRPKLADRMRCGVSSLDRAIAELVEAGAVVVQPNYRQDGSRTSNSYWLWPAAPPEADPTHQGLPPSPPVGTPLPAQRAASKEHQRKEHQTKITRPPDDVRTDAELVTAAFTAFWNAYPRRTAKGEARKAWPRAIKAAGGDLRRIVNGVRRYAADPNLPEPQFIPHPASWLNGERWDDEPLPQRPAKPSPPPGHYIDTTEESINQILARQNGGRPSPW